MNDYFTADDAEEYCFYRIPKPLILNPDYRSVPVEANCAEGPLRRFDGRALPPYDGVTKNIRR